ncbi:MAG: 4-hydroxyphenylpyruvate dioxygenase [Candidatus Krumholzibacteria bacterium]|jgi:4-hydroxyphenylpyruvate dioxygenase|nr:4-hydroxyphenylpyruvate dioxygenase [Candidatus Krumholzibacteria bacterium]MDP6668973.1 4-hydroxyphenylpyruvate dioxygenase [Candidatus Krumholzibacteria bacterium]MDP6796835.1 4-hydroxyphenylpyruvate dioxygenase [Candidatus Krumholzibacteria bacterium]MDP7021357.1 4-hydroxyphenylpyruvate dioxygenase [Candidatus Krumholzibacteria bacterium]
MSDFRILGFDHVGFYVSNAKQAAHYYRSVFGFHTRAYGGLETGLRDQTRYLLRQGKIDLLLSSPLEETGPIAEHVRLHGDGVKDVAFRVDNAEAAWKTCLERGAESAYEPYTLEDEKGRVTLSAIRTYGDTIHSFVERQDYAGIFLPGMRELDLPSPGKPVGLTHIDHIVGNQADAGMIPVVEWYEKILGFHRIWTVDDKDVSTEHSALRSIVVADPTEKVKMPINEPANGLKKSQIQEYIDYYKTPGVQHLAMYTSDIISTVKNLTDRGVDFILVPEEYYDELPDRVGEIDEDIPELAELGILVDRDDRGYLLQLFTQPVQDRPTLFFEFVQRKKARSFGKGNFKALFESIEREQALRGNL